MCVGMMCVWVMCGGGMGVSVCVQGRSAKGYICIWFELMEVARPFHLRPGECSYTLSSWL